MGETISNDVLRRKAKAGREEHQARVMSPARAMRLALSRSAETLFELALSVSAVHYEQLGQEAVLRSVDDEMLFVVLDGPDGAVGMVALDVPLVGGLVEKQTIGRVSTRASPERAATATDAALVAPYVSHVLEDMSEHLGPVDGKLSAGFRFGARLESKRHLGLILDAPDHHVLRAQIELEGGVRRGELVLCLPVAQPLPLAPAKGAKKTGEPPGPGMGEPKSQLRDGALMDARASFRAVLHRRQINLGELSELKPGSRLFFAASALSRVELDAGSASERLGPCKLGKQDGMRALKVQFGALRPRDDSFEPMAQMDPEGDLAAHIAYDLGGSGLGGGDMTPMTVDDLPDLSDLPGMESFETAAPMSGEPMPAGAESPALSEGDTERLSDTG